MKKLLLALILCFSLSISLKAQQYGLFNTKTMFDAFENPAQKAFTLDSSRQFQSNFLFPYLGLNVLNRGANEYIFRKIIQEGVNDTRSLDVNSTERNHISQITNAYILAFRIYKSYKYQKELGFSWQIKSEVDADYSNQTLSIFDSFKRFDANKSYNDIFNNDVSAQTYHQFSMVYRENWDKKWAFGGKVSLLSGIQHNALNVDRSSLLLNAANQTLDINLRGTYRGTFINSNEISKTDILPFKNFGLSASFGASYTSPRTGVMLMGNIKDLGFIRWKKTSHVFDIDYRQQISDLDDPDAQKRVEEGLSDVLKNSDQQRGFTSATNARADFLVSKTFEFYRPTFILSKNLYNKNGDIALVNNFTFNKFSGAFTPTYNLNGYLLFGLQGMYQTPNFEVFLGTDNVFKTYYTTKGIIQKSADVGNGYNGASVYLGMALKFGYTVEHPLNSSRMPGIGGNEEPSFFRNLFSIFKKKK